MAAGATYVPIATTTLGSAVASYTFSSIPSTYTDLVLVVNGSNTGAGGNYIQLNGDTATNYSVTYLYGDGTTAGSSRISTNATPYSLYFNTVQSTAILHVMNYANTTTYKTILNRSNSGDYVSERVTLWRSTAAISSILVGNTSYNYTAGTTFTLYGISAA